MYEDFSEEEFEAYFEEEEYECLKNYYGTELGEYIHWKMACLQEDINNLNEYEEWCLKQEETEQDTVEQDITEQDTTEQDELPF